MGNNEERLIELLEQLNKNMSDINIKTDKMITLLKRVCEKTEGM